MNNKIDKIISIHVPKTGGTTFRSLLEETFRNVNIQSCKPLFFRCRDEDKASVEINIDKITENVIHGHFTINQLKVKKHHFLLTWLRNPIDRVISHYFYWKNKPDINMHPIEKMIKFEGLSLRDFSKMSCMKNVQTYFIGSDISLFNFIGIMEEYDKSIMLLQNKLNVNFNYNKSKIKRINKAKESISEEDRQIIIENNLEDIKLYEKAKKKLGIYL